ncbi:nucleotidyltransferase domain-containing protein [Candidatus Magnetominusculus dajiuhuensis]|uniref:nucleotidyltransferase domain-containing protein n=1 Tax=Candidatus Magnetominusculus dajiuhuensis TaxID=3137712 RepID=UPI003B42BB30
MKPEMLSDTDPIVADFLRGIASLKGQIMEIYLFGSRTRSDWRPDSDYDILIVVEKKDRAIKDKLYDSVMDILLETGKLVSLKIFQTNEFVRLKSIPTPFMENVMREGIRLELHG